MNWWEALNEIAKDFPKDDPYINNFRASMFGKSNMLFEPVKSIETIPNYGSKTHSGSGCLFDILMSPKSSEP